MKVMFRFSGGLGNQMFQYAAGFAIAKKLGATLLFDTRECEYTPYALDVFNLEINIANNKEINELKFKDTSSFLKIKLRTIKVLNYLLLLRTVQQLIKSRLVQQLIKYNVISKILFRKSLSKIVDTPTMLTANIFHTDGSNAISFENSVFNIAKDTYFVGYWQSEKYFTECKDIIRKRFTLKKDLSLRSKRIKNDIHSKNAISLHIRRGDYTLPIHQKRFGLTNIEYYKKAVSYIHNKTDDTYFFVFSDDIKWCKENINFIDKVRFVEPDKQASDVEDMYLISRCKHNIIANSSFSWWGAYLNDNNEKIVIAPKKWFLSYTGVSDIIPDTWIKL